MLTLELAELTLFNEVDSTFVVKPAKTIRLEHSLASISKWESKFHKPFLTEDEKSREESVDYIRCMLIDESEDIVPQLTQEHVERINEHISAKMTATWFSEDELPRRGRQTVITSELVYYWMTALSIPMECEHWHLRRLFTLIRVANEKQKEAQNQASGKKKAPTRSDLQSRRALNEQRRKSLGTAG